MIQPYKGIVSANSLSYGKPCSWSENNYKIDLIFQEEYMSELLRKQRILKLSQSLLMNQKNFREYVLIKEVKTTDKKEDASWQSSTFNLFTMMVMSSAIKHG